MKVLKDHFGLWSVIDGYGTTIQRFITKREASEYIKLRKLEQSKLKKEADLWHKKTSVKSKEIICTSCVNFYGCLLNKCNITECKYYLYAMSCHSCGNDIPYNDLIDKCNDCLKKGL